MKTNYLLDGKSENLRLERQNSKPHYLIDDEISYKEIIFPNDSKILDVACGTGAFSEFLLKHNWNKKIHLEMLDSDKDRLMFLENKLSPYKKLDNFSLDFIHGDARKLPFAPNSFNAVIIPIQFTNAGRV